MRGEKELYVSSKLTLKELKVMVSSCVLQDLRFETCFILTSCHFPTELRVFETSGIVIPLIQRYISQDFNLNFLVYCTQTCQI